MRAPTSAWPLTSLLLPVCPVQFRDVLSQLSLHIFLSSEIKNATNSGALTDIGELEQDLVYGDKGSTELIKFMAGAGAGVCVGCWLASWSRTWCVASRAQWLPLGWQDARFARPAHPYARLEAAHLQHVPALHGRCIMLTCIAPSGVTLP